MTGIGIRVFSNSKVYYCLIEKQTDGTLNYLDISYLNVPLSINRPEALNFIRNTILDILTEYNVTKAVIRIDEFGGTLNSTAIERYYLEGVIQESLASSNVQNFFAGQISEITKVAKFQKTDFKKFANAEIDFTEIPPTKNWKNDFSLEERESILACYTSLNL